MLHRQGSHGQDTWGLPGGHLEYGESWEECVKREAMEEVGVEIENIRFIAATNDVFTAENKHYVTIFMVAGIKSGEVKNMEPDKAAGIDWFTYDSLPQNLFLPIINLKKQFPSLDF